MYINKEHPNPWTELWDFQLVGSSFNGDTGVSRQATLRRAAKKQAEFESVIVGLERYEFDGNPAYRVFFDGREAGNVPADVALELAEMESAGYLVDGEDCDVYGGPEDDFPDKKYGARLYVRVWRQPTTAEREASFAKLAAQAAAEKKQPEQPAGSSLSAPRQQTPCDDGDQPEPPPEYPPHAEPGRQETPPSDAPVNDKPIYRCWWFWPCALLMLCGLAAMIYGLFLYRSAPVAASVPPSSASVSSSSEDTGKSEDTFVLPDPIVYSGTSDDYFDIEPFDSLYYFEISGNGNSEYFGIIGYDVYGNRTELFVNTTDPYSGYVLDPGQDTRSLEVKASGAWSVKIRSLYDCPLLTVGEGYSGIGDDVLLLPSGCTAADISGNHAAGYFGVETYGNGHDLLVNTTDPYSGTVRLDRDATVMTIHASGSWSVTVR